MRVAVLSESPSDEAAIMILVEAVLGRRVERVAGPRLRSRGWPSVQSLLPIVIQHLHFKTDAEGLVVVVDSDSPVTHREAGCVADCRLCALRLAARSRLERLPARPSGTPLKIAVGLAVPAIEAWYRVGIDPRVTEAFPGFRALKDELEGWR